MQLVLTLLLASAGACLARQVSDSASRGEWTVGRELLQTVAPWVATPPACGGLKPESLSPPVGALVAAVFDVTGLENYTCVDNRWKVVGSRKDLYHSDTGDYAGFLYAEAGDPNNSRIVFTDPTNTTEWGEAVKDNQATFDYKPLDPEVNRKWWRRGLLRATGVSAGTVLVVKTDVQGGMPPDGPDCDSSTDTDLQVPMNNSYTFYACSEPVPIPHSPKCDPPASGSDADLAAAELYKAWEAPVNATCANGTLSVTGGTSPYGPGTYWADAAVPDGPVWPITKLIGEPLCDYILRSGNATGCGGSATYACLQCV